MVDFDNDLEKMSTYVVGRKIYDKWRLNPALAGTRALLQCGAIAVSKASRGESWSATAIIEDYAAWRGIAVSSARATMKYALKSAGIEVGPVGAVIILGHTRLCWG
jgi:hypothetical protein